MSMPEETQFTGRLKSMNLKRWILLSFALLLAVAFCTLQLPAQTQTTGEITGVVTDPSGATVVKAKVVLKDASSSPCVYGAEELLCRS